MNYIILDLEWNGAYSKKTHGYFNEIIEIGSTKLDENLKTIGTLHLLIKPEVSKKITNLVTDLTGIQKQELEYGCSFPKAVKKMRNFFDEDSVLITWSTTDLLVLMENNRYFMKENKVPFGNYYLDAQAFCQHMLSEEHRKQQLGLASACELLGVSDDDLTLHRAQDDSELTARVFRKIYNAEALNKTVRYVNDEFYKRLLFKPKVITKANHPLVKPEYLTFACPVCQNTLKIKGRWRSSCKMLCAEMHCSCGKKYTARVQVKELYDSISVRKRLTEEVEVENTESIDEG